MRRRFLLASLFLATFTFGCSAAKEDDGFTLEDGGTDGGFSLDGGEDGNFDISADGPVGPCEGLRCQVKACGGGADTTVSGTVYAPNGTLPLYNVIVYVPNLTPLPLTKGVTCDKCGAIASGDPITTALTDYKGNFTLKGVPVGSDIPLVIQLGKWRRQVKITVNECVDNKLTDKNLTRLPKNRKEGDLPKIAVTTGGCDQLSCMLPKVGIDASEFGVDGSDKAVHFYSGSGGGGPSGMKPASALWDNVAKLKEYDIAVFSCECYEAYPGSKSDASFAAVDQYLKAGGRIFSTDFQYLWYKKSPDAAMRAAMGTIPGGAPSGENPVTLDTTFPKGKALADWLAYVDKTGPYGKVQCDYVFGNYTPVDKTKAQVWATSNGSFGSPTGINPRFITVNTPVGKPVEEQCGKAVHLDAHINQSDSVDASYPAGCKTAIKQGEEAFAFFFFDLASCIQKEGDPPKAPPVK